MQNSYPATKKDARLRSQYRTLLTYFRLDGAKVLLFFELCKFFANFFAKKVVFLFNKAYFLRLTD